MTDRLETIAGGMFAIIERQQALLVGAGQTINHLIELLPNGERRAKAVVIADQYRLAVQATKEAIQPIEDILK